MNIWDVGGQKTIRNYWKNYFEETDAVIWVIDSADYARMDLCKQEFRQIIFEEVSCGTLEYLLEIDGSGCVNSLQQMRS